MVLVGRIPERESAPQYYTERYRMATLDVVPGHGNHQRRYHRAGTPTVLGRYPDAIRGFQFAREEGPGDRADRSIIVQRRRCCRPRLIWPTRRQTWWRPKPIWIKLLPPRRKPSSTSIAIPRWHRTVLFPRSNSIQRAQLHKTRSAAVGAAKAQVTQAVTQAQQEVALRSPVAQTNLDHSTIRSPIDGTVIARRVDVGQTVAASLQAPTLFTITQHVQPRCRYMVSTDKGCRQYPERDSRSPSKWTRSPRFV